MLKNSELKLNKKSNRLATVPGKNIIGVFDSGLGGLTIFKYFLKDLPNYNYIYLGDSARQPYGEKSAATIYEYTKEAVDFLFSAGCELVILACNTASSQALRRLQEEYLPTNYPQRRILGVIRPLAESIVQDKSLKTIGVIGTKATINSHAYATEINKLDKTIKIIETSTPLLVPLIEEGWDKKPETKMILKKYLHPLRTKQIKALILGCTHYPFLYKQIKQILGHGISLPQPGEILATSLKAYLSRHSELGITENHQPRLKYYTTDSPEQFKKLGEKFLERKITNLAQVSISELKL
ncbi:MAG: glutamate racemase [Patescibacteria group bacterium]